MHDFDDIAGEEAALAARLADALENGPLSSTSDDSADKSQGSSEVDSLLVYASLARISGKMELPKARSLELREEVVSTEKLIAQKTRRSGSESRSMPWWLIWLPVPALGIGLLLIRPAANKAPHGLAPAALSLEAKMAKLPASRIPPTTPALLEAQALALAAQASGQGRENTREELRLEMRSYRQGLLAQLDETSARERQ